MSDLPPRRPHWLRGAGRTKTPRVVVSFDTETQVNTGPEGEYLTLRCWDLIVRLRDKDTSGEDILDEWSGETAKELALTLEAAASMTDEVWCFAHNAGFDLTVTSLPMLLTSMGWEPEFVNIGDETCVFILTWTGRRIVITDTWSWLRCSLQTAAADVGMRKTRLPDDDDTLTAWHHRCLHDVRILDRLIADMLDWWDTEDLGAFAVTGSACGWRSFRARIPEKTILVGAEQPRTRFEREALYGGRKEVWHVGRIRNRIIEDWDLTAAHLTTLANLPMPAQPVKTSRLLPHTTPLEPPDGLGAISRVQITTRVPCAPVRASGVFWWPVGTFTTVLTSVELQAVKLLADQVKVLDTQWYRLTDAMTDWAQWCLGLQGAAGAGIPRVVKRVAKGWGRAVPGRFAMRTTQLLSERPATHLGWKLETGHDLDTGAELEILTYGGVERTYRRDMDGNDVSPAVLAFVEGYVRAAMLHTLTAHDPCQLLQCNTDGWWQIKQGRGRSDSPNLVPAPYSAVLKATTRDVTILGPNHVDSAGDRRLAGIPKDAHQSLDGSYSWQDWPGLRWQLQHSRPGQYRRPGREMQLADHYCRRWVLTSGETVPVSVAQDPGGALRLLPWSETSCRRPGDELAAHQIQPLAALRDEQVPWACAGDGPDPRIPGRLPG